MKTGGIRSARAGEHTAVQDCVNAAYFKYVERIGKKPAPMLADYSSLIAGGSVYVIPGQFGIRGVLVAMREGGSVLVENVAVDPIYQGRGLGQRLMGFAERLAAEDGLREIRLYTNEVMAENIAYYRGLGFEEVERRVDQGYRRVFMRKTLPQP